jgi:S1-C subfamily serine protease
MNTPPPARKRTLYDILGVPQDANAIDIGVAYKKRVAELDRNASADPNEIILVNEAYHILCMPNERAAYDARLISNAEKAAAKESAQSPDFVLEPDEEEAPPAWKNKWALGGAAALLALVAVWAMRSPPPAAPAKVAAPAVTVIEASKVVLEPPRARSGEELFADLSRSIARITIYDVSGRAVGIGSGVVVGNGTIVTSCHVASAGGTLQVKVGAEQYSASVEVADEEYDLCRLSVGGLTAPAVALGTVESLRTGQKVYAIGAPQGLDLTISDGIVSALRDLPQGKVIQTTAPISPGSSGGGLFDAYGKLVGIMTFQHRTGQNLNFAVPADWIPAMRARSTATPLTESISKSVAPN